MQKSAGKGSQAAGLTFYKDGQLTTRSQIVLKKTEDIESYVVKTVQNYYRSTYKNGMHILIKQVLINKANFLIMALTLLIQLKSQCKLKKIWDT